MEQSRDMANQNDERAAQLLSQITKLTVDDGFDEPIPSEVHRSEEGWIVITHEVDEETGYQSGPRIEGASMDLVDALVELFGEGPSAIDLVGLPPFEAVELLRLEPLRSTVRQALDLGGGLRVNRTYCELVNGELVPEG